MKKLTLIRGLPGSGKSTLAEKLAAATGAEWVEADTFFLVDGKYVYDPQKIGEAHAWCQIQALRHMAQGRDVIVSNTFSRVWEMAIYREMAYVLGYAVDIEQANGNWPNIHGVPDAIVAGMRERWEDLNSGKEVSR